MTRLDGTADLLRHGYAFIPRRCRRLGTDVFETRLLGQRTICMHGPGAARVFYDEERFERTGAVPGFVRRTLTGDDGVQTLDGDEHRHRKHLFMSLLPVDRVGGLLDATAAEWRKAIPQWASRAGVVLFDETQPVLCRAVCRWAGVPLREDETVARARDLAAMVDGFGTIGLRQLRGRRARRRSEAWIGDVIDEIRATSPPEQVHRPAEVVAHHRDLDGSPLPREVAAVELLNIVRPVVALSTYITFAAVALHGNPTWRERIRSGDDEAVEPFVHEVRRYFPFAPFLGARVRDEFEWSGQRFPVGALALLDVYGTLHDSRLWDRPYEFRPERFEGWHDTGFALIPQGAGEYDQGHRCAGEPVTIEVMKLATRLLCRDMDYGVPPQDLRIDLRRIPAVPESRFVMTGVTGRESARAR